jgi:hypothetical protein
MERMPEHASAIGVGLQVAGVATPLCVHCDLSGLLWTGQHNARVSKMHCRSSADGVLASEQLQGQFWLLHGVLASEQLQGPSKRRNDNMKRSVSGF